MSEKSNREKAKVALAVNQTSDAIEALDATPNEKLKELVEEFRGQADECYESEKFELVEAIAFHYCADELEALINE